MPHSSFKCPDPYMAQYDEAAGETHPYVPIKDCLDCALSRLDRACEWDYADLAARVENSYSEVFSPSRMNGCLRQQWYQDRVDFWTDPAEQSRRVRGSGMHRAFEVDHEQIIGEARVYRTLKAEDGSPLLDWQGQEVLISVQPDKVYPKLGVIHDDKTWAYLPVERGRPKAIGYDYPERGKPGLPKPRAGLVQVGEHRIDPDWVRQLSIGAWAWRDPLTVKYPGGTWDEHPSPLDIREGHVSLRAQVQLRIAHIPLMPDAEVEAWMRERVAAINAMKTAEEPPDYIEPKGRWKCATCPTRYLCGIPKELYEKKK
jgi:hypothetical protein